MKIQITYAAMEVPTGFIRGHVYRNKSFIGDNLYIAIVWRNEEALVGLGSGHVYEKPQWEYYVDITDQVSIQDVKK